LRLGKKSSVIFMMATKEATAGERAETKRVVDGEDKDFYGVFEDAGGFTKGILGKSRLEEGTLHVPNAFGRKYLLEHCAGELREASGGRPVEVIVDPELEDVAPYDFKDLYGQREEPTIQITEHTRPGALASPAPKKKSARTLARERVIRDSSIPDMGGDPVRHTGSYVGVAAAGKFVEEVTQGRKYKPLAFVGEEGTGKSTILAYMGRMLAEQGKVVAFADGGEISQGLVDLFKLTGGKKGMRLDSVCDMLKADVLIVDELARIMSPDGKSHNRATQGEVLRLIKGFQGRPMAVGYTGSPGSSFYDMARKIRKETDRNGKEGISNLGSRLGEFAQVGLWELEPEDREGFIRRVLLQRGCEEEEAGELSELLARRYLPSDATLRETVGAIECTDLYRGLIPPQETVALLENKLMGPGTNLFVDPTREIQRLCDHMEITTGSLLTRKSVMKKGKPTMEVRRGGRISPTRALSAYWLSERLPGGVREAAEHLKIDRTTVLHHRDRLRNLLEREVDTLGKKDREMREALEGWIRKNPS